MSDELSDERLTGAAYEEAMRLREDRVLEDAACKIEDLIRAYLGIREPAAVRALEGAAHSVRNLKNRDLSRRSTIGGAGTEPGNETVPKNSATWTFDEKAFQDGYGALYYFAPVERAPGPYRTQRHVDAILDIASDGTLAGVELIDNMPPPHRASPPLPTPDRAKLIERLREIADNLDIAGIQSEADPIREAAAALSSLDMRPLEGWQPIETALSNLVSKLDEMDMPVHDVFVFAGAHGYIYNGPNYGDELKAARAALAALPAPPIPSKGGA